MRKKRNRHVSFLIFLVSALLLSEMLCYGRWDGPGIQKTFPWPLERVRTVILEVLYEGGVRVEPGLATSGRIRGWLEGYAFDIRTQELTGNATRVSLNIAGSPGKELPGFETFVMHLFTKRLSLSIPAGDQIPSPVSPASGYEAATVCLYGSNHRETFQSSGIVISQNGLVLTTAHEISEARALFVKWPDKEVSRGEIAFKSKVYDLALVATERVTRNFVAMPEPESLDIAAGKVIYGLGCPYGLMGTLSRGRIAASPRMVGGILLFQCDLSTYPGNSGGPVFDGQGNLLGLVKGRLRDTNDISFVIPSFYLSIFLKQNQNKRVYKTPGSHAKDWVSWFASGLAASKDKRKEEAFRKVLALRPGFTPALYHLGLLLTRDKRLKEELAVWRRLTSLNAGWSEAWYRLGNTLFKSNRLADAEKAYKRAIRLSSDDQRYYNNLGELYRREKKCRKAEIYFREALSHNPRYAIAHYNLGVLFDQEVDRPELAVYHYREYLKLRPRATDRNQVEKWIREARKRF